MLPEPADRVAFYPVLHPSDPVIDGTHKRITINQYSVPFSIKAGGD